MTLTSAFTHTVIGNKITYTALITATSNDTTDPINTPWINIDGLDIRSASFSYVATSAGASTTTANLLLQATHDGTNAFTVDDTSGNDIATGATTIGAATTTVPVSGFVDTEVEGRQSLPYRAIRGQLDQGGVAGFTGVIRATLNLR